VLPELLSRSAQRCCTSMSVLLQPAAVNEAQPAGATNYATRTSTYMLPSLLPHHSHLAQTTPSQDESGSGCSVRGQLVVS
jgi:hypothetical protein